MKHKLKHFIWKYLNGSLFVNAVHHQRTGKGDPIYKSYGEKVEIVKNAVLWCMKAEEA